MEIKVHNNNVEQALKAFKQKLTKSGLIREMRARRFYDFTFLLFTRQF